MKILDDERTVVQIQIQETREFVIEIKQGGAWKEIARGTTIGAEKEITFAPVRARHVRLNVFEVVRPIDINEFQVFSPEKRP